MGKEISVLLVLLVILSSVSAVLVSDQGTSVKNKTTGELLSLGNLSINIYDASSDGTLIYNQTFSDAIANGSWNLMISPSLEYGKIYWKDYSINGQDLDFDGNERISFQSSLGMINNASFMNFSLIGSCGDGNSIRQIYENGSVVCEADDNGGGANMGNYALKNQSETFEGNLTTSQIGFFGWLGSLASRITKLWVGDINATGDIETTGNVTASYFIGDGGLLTNIPPGAETDPYWLDNFTAYNSSWSSTYNSTYDAYNSTGLIKDWNATGYIKDWNATGLIINWSGNYLTIESDPLFVLGNSTIWESINNKLEREDQRYNETILILSINTTSNVMALGFYNKSEIEGLISSIETGNSTWNQSLADTLYYSIKNPMNFINSTNAELFNETILILEVNSSLWDYIFSREIIWSSTYNSTYNAYNSTGLIKDWNATGWIKDWNATGYIVNWSQIISGGTTYTHLSNFTNNLGFWNSTFATFNKTYADTLYYGINNPYGYFNTTYRYNCSSGYYVQNITINSSGVFGMCSAVTTTETDPYWSANYTAYNSSWSSTYNSTYNTWAYNQTIPSMSYTDSKLINFLNLSGTNANQNVNINNYNITSSGTGFFGWLGSLASRITKLWVGDINATGNIETSENVSARYFKGDGSLLSNLPAGAELPGVIKIYAGASAPGGYLLCDGANLSRAEYASLFAVIGTTYGNNSIDDFKVPNITGRVVVAKSSDAEFDNLGEAGGEKNHILNTGEMPSHTHGVNPPDTAASVTDPGHTHNIGNQLRSSTTGSSSTNLALNNDPTSTQGNYNIVSSTTGVSASVDIAEFNTASNGTGNSFNVLQPYITLNYIIKY